MSLGSSWFPWFLGILRFLWFSYFSSFSRCSRFSRFSWFLGISSFSKCSCFFVVFMAAQNHTQNFQGFRVCGGYLGSLDPQILKTHYRHADRSDVQGCPGFQDPHDSRGFAWYLIHFLRA